MNEEIMKLGKWVLVLLFVSVVSSLIISKVEANDSVDINNANAYDNEVQQSQTAAQSNTMINQSNYNRHSFGQGITCSEDGLFVTGYTSESGKAGVQMGYNHVFGKKSCKKMASERARQVRLDTDLEIVERCMSYMERGFQLDVNIFPWAEKCQGLYKAQ